MGSDTVGVDGVLYLILQIKQVHQVLRFKVDADPCNHARVHVPAGVPARAIFPVTHQVRLTGETG